MQKGILVIFLVFLLFGIVVNAPILIADDDSDNSGSGSDSSGDSDDGDRERSREEIKKEFRLEDGSRVRIERKVEIRDGEVKIRIIRKITDADGNEREIKIIIERKDGRRKIKMEGIEGLEVDTELEIDDEFGGNESELVAIMSNGRRAKIKIMPDQVVEIALERLRAQNFTIELKETVHENRLRVIYNIKTNKTGRFLGIFKLRLRLEGQIDPETGEFLGVVKPWWAFLVVGEDSDQVGRKTTLCHIPPGDPSAAHTINVGTPAVNAHLAHGDTLGACSGEEGNETSPPENETTDTVSPLWFDSSTNSTVNGTFIEHSVRWTDDTNLSGYIFSFDNGIGTFTNDSFVAMSGTEDWSNVSKMVNSATNSTIRWRVYANDTSDNWGETDVFSYNTTS